MSLKRTAGFFLLMIMIDVLSAHAAVIVDSLTGKAEVQRAGRFAWNGLKPGDTVCTNDLIRALDSSRLVLRWDDNRIFLRANTQIRINTFDDEQSGIITRHVTAFFGAVFFIVKQAMPKPLINNADFKVFTPTTVVAIRGTAFCVEADRISGKTMVTVLEGMVLVRNIIRNVSLFVAGPYKTEVQTNADPIVPQPVLPADIAGFKAWVPATIIDDAMKKQPASSTGGGDSLKKVAVILGFDNRSTYQGSWEIGRSIAEALTERMRNVAGAIPVTFVAQAQPVDPLIYGAQSKTRFVVAGQILEFDVSQHSKVTPAADKYSEYSLARVRIRIQIVDATLRQLLYEDSFIGEIENPDMKANAWPAMRNLPFDVKNPGFMKTALARATEEALAKAAESLAPYLRSK